MSREALSDNDLRLKAFEALNNALGPSNTIRFLSMMHRDNTDYVEISKKLYKGQTIDDIFERAKKRRKESKEK